MSTANEVPSLDALLAERTWLVALTGRLVKSVSDAEDIAQETMTRALQADMPDVTSSQGALRAWLSTTARNVIRERFRRRTNREAREAGVAQHESQVSNAEAIARAELRESLASHVLDLPEAERLAVVLKYFEGLDGASIAGRLGLPSAGAARQRISRGVALLRERLDGAEGGREKWLGVAAGIAGVELPSIAGGRAAARSSIDPSSTATRAAWSPAQLALATCGVLVCSLAAVIFARSLDRGAAERRVQEAASLARLEPNLASVTAPDEVATPSVAAERQPAAAAEPEAPAAPELAVALPETIRVADPAAGTRSAATDGAGVPFVLGDTGGLDQTGELVAISGPPAYTAILEGTTGPGGIVAFPADIERHAYRNDAFGGTPLLALMTRRTEHYARSSFALELTSEERAKDATLTLPLQSGATVTGRVVDQHGEPVDATLWLESIEERFVRAVRTEADGTFELRHIADLPRSFVLDPNGTPFPSRTMPTTIGFTRGDLPYDNNYGTRLVREVFVGDQAAVRIDDVVIERSVQVRGRVIDAYGNRVEGAKVSGQAGTLEQLGIFPSASSLPDVNAPLRDGEAQTDADGRFVVDVRGGVGKNRKMSLFTTHPGGATSRDRVSLAGTTSDEVEIVVRSDQSFTLALRDRETNEPVEKPRADFTEGVRLTLLGGQAPAFARGTYLPLHADGIVKLRPSQVPKGQAFEILVGGYEPAKIVFDGTSHRMNVALEKAPVLELQLDVRNYLGVHQEIKVTRSPAGVHARNATRRRRSSPEDLLWEGPGDSLLRLPLHGGQAVELFVDGYWKQGRMNPRTRTFGPFLASTEPQTIAVQFEAPELTPRMEALGPWHPDSPLPSR